MVQFLIVAKVSFLFSMVNSSNVFPILPTIYKTQDLLLLTSHTLLSVLTAYPVHPNPTTTPTKT
jgi:hypothetical protein